MLVTLFLWSGIAKSLQPEQFAATVGAYGLLPDLLILPVAVSLILAEIIAAIGLLFEKRGSLTLITLFAALFLISTPALSWDNKFEKEVKIEQQAVKLAREIQRGGYDGHYGRIKKVARKRCRIHNRTTKLGSLYFHAAALPRMAA